MSNDGKYKDITGKKFGKLTAIKFIERKDEKTYWLFKCDCGKKVIKSTNNIGRGVKSCGCLKKEQNFKNLNLDKSYSNGLYDTKLYKIWASMKDRCYNKNNHAYDKYGNRGIIICEEWLNKENGFIKFYNWSMRNGYKEGLSIDRINNDKEYSPRNCRWTTMKQQCNNRSNNTKININGIIHNLGEWCSIFKINRKTVSTRIHRGEDPLTAILYVLNKSDKRVGDYLA